MRATREKARTDAYGFGDKAINASIFVDLAGRIALDPFNLLLGAGVPGKATKLATWATNPLTTRAGALLGAAGSRLAPVWGVGYLSDMAGAGIRAATKPSGPASADRIIAGDMRPATLRGLGHVLNVPRALLLPGTGSLARRYARGAVRT